MKKKVLIIAGIVFLFLIAAGVAIPFIFKDKIKGMILAEGEKFLNAKLNFEKFDLSVYSSFPDLRVSIGDFLITGIEDFEGDTLVYMKNFVADADIMTVIKGEKIGINTIILDNPVIKLEVMKDGKASWDIMKDTDKKDEKDETATSFAIKLKNFEINKARILYKDKKDAMSANVNDLDLKLKGDFTQDFTNVKTTVSAASVDVVSGGIKYLSKAALDLTAEVSADMKNSKYEFKDNELKINQLVLGFEGFVANPGDDISVDIKYFAKKTEFKNLLSLIPTAFTKDFEKVETSGKLALDGYAKGVYAGESLPAFGLNLLVENARFKYPDLPKSVEKINVKMSVTNKGGSPDNTITDIQKFHFEIGDSPMDMKFLIKTPISDPDIDGQIRGKINLAGLRDVMPLEKDDKLTGTIISDITLKGKNSSIEKKQYEQFDAKGQLIILDFAYSSPEISQPVNIKTAYLNFSPKFVELSKFESTIGKSDFAASGKIENFIAYYFSDAVLKGSFDVRSRLVDLNEFMAESDDSKKPAAADTIPLSVIDIPGNIDFRLSSNFERLLYDNIEMKGVSGVIIVKDSKAELSNLRMGLMEGFMTLNGVYDVSNEKFPKVNFGVDINGFDITKTFNTFNTVQKLAPIAKYATGKFSTGLKFNALLDQNMQPIMNSLTGDGNMKTETVVLKNFEPLNKVADAIKMDKYKSLDLKDIKLAYKFTEGKVIVEPFDIKLGNTNLKINGSNGFDQTIDYTMKFEIPRAEFGGAANTMLNNLVAQANSKGAGVTLGETVNLEALIGGTVTSPTVKTNIAKAVGGMADDLKNKALEELNKKKEELEKKAREEADKLKKQAEAEADRLKKEAEDKVKGEADKLKKQAEDKVKAEQDKLKEEAEKKKKEAEEKAKKEAADKLKGIFGKPK